MSDHPNEVQTYVDDNGEHRWRVVVTPGTPGGTEADVIAVSPDGYKNFDDAAKAFFRMFFEEWNDSFLAFYNKWNPEVGEVTIDDIAQVPLAEATLDEPPPDSVQALFEADKSLRSE